MTVETLSRGMQNLISSLERVAVRIKSMISGSRDFLKKTLDVQKCSVCVARHIAAWQHLKYKFKFSSKGLNKRVLEDSADSPMSKYRRLLDEAINLTSSNRGFRTINHMVATYEQTKKGLSYFYPKRQVQDDEIDSKHLAYKN